MTDGFAQQLAIMVSWRGWGGGE